MYRSIAVYNSVRCKRLPSISTLKFAQPCVLFARLSPSETIHLVVVPASTSTFLHVTAREIEKRERKDINQMK